MDCSTKDRDNTVMLVVAVLTCIKVLGGMVTFMALTLNAMYFNDPHKSNDNGVNCYNFKDYHYSLKKIEIRLRPW